MGSNGSREAIFRSPRDAEKAYSNFSKKLGELERAKHGRDHECRVRPLVPASSEHRRATNAIAGKEPLGWAIRELR